MGFKFNPTTGQLDLVGSSSGGGSTYDPTTDTIHILKAGDTMTGGLIAPALSVNVTSGNPEFVLQSSAVTKFKVFYDSTNNLVGFQTPSTFNFGGSVLPQANAAYNLGSTALYWSNLYASRHYVNATAYLDGATAGQITVSGNLSVTNIVDSNGANALNISATSGAVNYLQIQNKVANGVPVLAAVGSDTNIGFAFATKGTGVVQIQSTQLQFSSVQANPLLSQSRAFATGAGYNLSVTAQAAQSAQTDLNGGNVIFNSGISTGAGASAIVFNTAGGGTTGTADKAVTEAMRITGTNLVGFGTNAPTHTLTLPSVATGIALYNTTDQTANFERGVLSWVSNQVKFVVEKGGTGVARSLNIGTSAATLLIAASSGTTGWYNFGTGTATANANGAVFSGSWGATSGANAMVQISPTITQTVTAGYTALLINPTETTVGSGNKYLIDAQVGGATKFRVENTGNTVIGNMTLSSVTGGGKIQGSAGGAFNVTDQVYTSAIQVTGNVTPEANGTRTLGTSALYWSNEYTTRLNLNNTAYLDGATAGTIATNGTLGINISPTHTLDVGATSTQNTLRINGISTTNIVPVLSMFRSGSAEWAIAGGGTTTSELNISLNPAGYNDAQINTAAILKLASAGMSLGTTTPTHTLTLPSTSTGIAIYNTVDQTTNYERVLMKWTTNIFRIEAGLGGTGVARSILLGTVNRNLLIADAASASGFYQYNSGSGTAGAVGTNFSGTWNAASGAQTVVSIQPTLTQTVSAGYTALLINPTETTTGSGTKYLIDAQVGGTSKFRVDNTGTPTIPLNAGTGKVLTSDANGAATWQTPTGGGTATQVSIGHHPGDAVGHVGAPNQFFANLITATVTETVTTMQAFCVNVSGSNVVQMGIYDASGTLLASGTATVTTTGAFSITLGSSVSLTRGTNYWFALCNQTNTAGTTFAYFNSNPNTVLLNQYNGGASLAGTLPNANTTATAFCIMAY